MAALDMVRALIQDTSTAPRIMDTELQSIMAAAMLELNAWANTTWSVSDLDTVPCSVPLTQQQIFYLVVKMLVIDSTLANADSGLKFVTQDVQLDASSGVQRLNRTRQLLVQELDKKLTYWIGIKSGGVLRHTGEAWGGE